MEDASPPSLPPPLLSDFQLRHLVCQGWLTLPLSGVLEADLKQLTSATLSFFNQEESQKSLLYPSAATAEGTERGFYYVQDEKQYITLRSKVYSDSELEVQAERVWLKSAALLQRVLVDIAKAFDMPSNVFEPLLDGCLSLPARPEEAVPTLLRLFQYFPGSGYADQHKDLGLLTLCVGEGRGLQLFGRGVKTSGWVDALGPTVVVGETLRVLMSDRVQSGLHRVVQNSQGRSSIIFALRPSHKHQIDLTLFGREGSIAADQLFETIKASKRNINAAKVIRDRQTQAIKARHNIDPNTQAVPLDIATMQTQ